MVDLATVRAYGGLSAGSHRLCRSAPARDIPARRIGSRPGAPAPAGAGPPGVSAAPRFVRTPSGVSRPDLAEAFAQLQLTNVAWDVCGLELLYRNPARIAARIARLARNGSIILLHESYYGTRIVKPEQALTTAQLTIALLRERGFRFVRLDHLLKQPGFAASPIHARWLPEEGGAMANARIDESTTHSASRS